jgi:hypothetical protein
MQRLGPIGRGIAIATLFCFAAPQAEAIEVYGAGLSSWARTTVSSFRFAEDAAACIGAAAACTEAAAACMGAAACITE